jgi:hypothetical protein
MENTISVTIDVISIRSDSDDEKPNPKGRHTPHPSSCQKDSLTSRAAVPAAESSGDIGSEALTRLQ